MLKETSSIIGILGKMVGDFTRAIKEMWKKEGAFSLRESLCQAYPPNKQEQLEPTLSAEKRKWKKEGDDIGCFISRSSPKFIQLSQHISIQRIARICASPPYIWQSVNSTQLNKKILKFSWSVVPAICPKRKQIFRSGVEIVPFFNFPLHGSQIACS